MKVKFKLLYELEMNNQQIMQYQSSTYIIMQWDNKERFIYCIMYNFIITNFIHFTSIQITNISG
jgi:hypothetical protein